MGGGLLGAVATISTIRYWAAGFAGGGDSGFAALEGLTRTVGAALFLAIWPWLFDTAVSLTNLFTSSLLGSGAVVHSVSHLLAAGLGAGIALNFTPIGLFLDIAIAVAASLLFLGLLLVKIVVSISTDPGVHRHAAGGRGLAGGAVDRAGGDARVRGLPAGARDVGAVLRRLGRGEPERDQLQRLERPERPARAAGRDRAAVGDAAAADPPRQGGDARCRAARRRVRLARGQLRRRLPATRHRPPAPPRLGRRPAGFKQRADGAGREPHRHQAAPSRDARRRERHRRRDGCRSRGRRRRSERRERRGRVGSASTATGSGTGGNGRSYTPPPTAQANAAGHAGQGGLQTPSFREQDFANETFEARFRERTSPVSAEQATAALQALPADTQRGIGQLVSEHGAGAREHLAYQAMGEWSPEEREALRTLAAASPEIRAQALGDTAETGDQQRWLDARGRHEPGCGEASSSEAPRRSGPPRPPSTAAAAGRRQPEPAPSGSTSPTLPDRAPQRPRGLIDACRPSSS